MSGWKKLAAASAAGGGVNVESLFSTRIYEGNASTNQIINNVDLASLGGIVWTKRRDGSISHAIYDTVRGASGNDALIPNTDDSVVSGSLSSFNSNGFTLDSDSRSNANNDKMVAWSFAAHSKFCDVIQYTGDGNSSRMINHNLGCEVGFIMAKRTDGSGDWMTYHRAPSLNGMIGPGINENGAPVATGVNTHHTTTQFKPSMVRDQGNTDANQTSGATYIAYLFAHNNNDGGFGESGDQDCIKCGDYTGDGGTNNAINIGFEPQFLIIKKTTTSGGTGSWVILDTMRGLSFNQGTNRLTIDSPNAEYESTSYNAVGITSTGFRLTRNEGWYNASGVKYAYIAIRRPMAAATSGAEVFKAAYANSSTSAQPTWSAPQGFTVDASIDLNVGGSSTDNPSFGARQIQFRYSENLFNSSGPQFYSWVGQSYDYSDGFRDGSNGSTDLGYMWQRKPKAFDTFCFKGTGSNMTHTHNLGGEIGMAWWFTVSTSTHIYVYARPLGANKYLRLNGNAAANTDTLLWQNTHPTDTNFYTGGGYNNTNENHIVLLFGNASGISKVGTFTGNGTNQNIDCGFSNGIRFLMVKKTNSTGNWYFWDEANLTASNQPFWYIQSQAGLIQNQDTIDTYSAGFNIKFNTNQSINTNGDTYLYYAIAA